MTKLSYSSLNTLLNGKSHEWLNKQMGLKVPEYSFLTEGKAAHDIIQKHISGKELHKDLAHIELRVPVVEEVTDENDPNYWKAKEKCKFEFVVNSAGAFDIHGNELQKYPSNIAEQYTIYGYLDGRDEDYTKFVEIKSSSTLWSMGKFKNAEQRKIYALSNPNYKEAYLITCYRDLAKWEKEKPKLYRLEISTDDYLEAMAWIIKGIKKLEAGEFNGGLDENGKCTGCFYGQNCHFL